MECIKKVEYNEGLESIEVIYIEKDKKENSIYFDSEGRKLSRITTLGLHALLTELIIRFANANTPNELDGIERLSKRMISELVTRRKNAKEKNARRNKLIKYLREKLERLKK